MTTFIVIFYAGFVTFFIVAFFLFAKWANRFRIDFNYTRRVAFVWYKGTIVNSYNFSIGEEENVIKTAKEWFKKSKVYLDKYA
jgi:hypothetical protein